MVSLKNYWKRHVSAPDEPESYNKIALIAAIKMLPVEYCEAEC